MKAVLQKTALVLCLAMASPAFAKWRLSDQINMITNQINTGVQSLQGQIQAQGMTAVYAEVGRSNDVFTFCQQGVPTDYWIGVNPTTGQYQVTNWWYVNVKWIPYYVTICPYGGKTPGAFKNGDGAAFKAGPNAQVPLSPFPH